METGRGPNRAWSGLSSSPSLFTHAGVCGQLGLHFVSGCRCHVITGAPSAWRVQKSTPPSPPCRELSLTLTKRASGRPHTEWLVITTNHTLNGASKMSLSRGVEKGYSNVLLSYWQRVPEPQTDYKGLWGLKWSKRTQTLPTDFMCSLEMSQLHSKTVARNWVSSRVSIYRIEHWTVSHLII